METSTVASEYNLDTSRELDNMSKQIKEDIDLVTATILEFSLSVYLSMMRVTRDVNSLLQAGGSANDLCGLVRG